MKKYFQEIETQDSGIRLPPESFIPADVAEFPDFKGDSQDAGTSFAGESLMLPALGFVCYFGVCLCICIGLSND
jgi:hypothetical protein